MCYITFNMILVLFVSAALFTCALSLDIKPIEDVVREFGYDVETHTIRTSDHYMLTVHRLVRGTHHAHLQDSSVTSSWTSPTSPEASTSPAGTLPDLPDIAPHFASTRDYGVPVLLVEGILQSSASNLAKGNGIAYSLADRGFDVWLPNYRGNMYSRQHEHILPSQPAFWNFTLHEMGTKDLPAVIDYVLEATHRQQLIYLGFSMGTTMFWVLASSLPAYQAKVAAMVAIGPVARPSNIFIIKNSVLRKMLNGMFTTMWAVNDCELMSHGTATSTTINWICNEKFRFLCENFLNNMNFLRQQQMEINNAFKLIPYSPAGISTKVIIHFIQIADARRFQQFDYGKKGNTDMYGSPEPPEYDLKKVTLPVLFVYSEKDEVATSQDVEWLAEQLPRRPPRKILSVNNFHHVDFSLNTDLENRLTKPLTSLVVDLAEEHSATLAFVIKGYKDNLGTLIEVLGRQTPL